MKAVAELKPLVGLQAACESLAIPPSTWYRSLQPKRELAPRPSPPRTLSEAERETVLEVLTSPRFVDMAPKSVFATLLDEGIYHCSTSTFYRILSANEQVRERRNQLTHPEYHKPELLAERPNEVWTWDITDLRGPKKWNKYKLYLILDIFSRCVVGWAVFERESSVLAERLLKETCKKHGIQKEQLTIHADRGSSMRSKTVGQLFIELGVTKSHSRPYTSSDNPYSESQFKTMKYRPTYPKRFSCIQEARDFVRMFVHWYNHEHRHSGIGLMPPAAVHSGEAHELRRKRNEVLECAYSVNPERFVNGCPQAPALPDAVWINKPKDAEVELLTN
ncbi:MAG: IS3 family transposase [Planctomycetes bacterium]|nr:IS3 family transposase [Planctomycetota bacterium]